MANVATEDRGKKRAKLTRAATDLFYKQGVGNTKLSDVAEASKVPLGNIYYHFKTKDDLTKAVIKNRAAELAANLAEAECEAEPLDKLLSLIHDARAYKDALTQYGCPYSSLFNDLDKLGEQDTGWLFQLYLDYAERQFAALELDNPSDLAVELISSMQGAYLLANALKSQELLESQLDRLESWLNALI